MQRSVKPQQTPDWHQRLTSTSHGTEGHLTTQLKAVVKDTIPHTRYSLEQVLKFGQFCGISPPPFCPRNETLSFVQVLVQWVLESSYDFVIYVYSFISYILDYHSSCLKVCGATLKMSKTNLNMALFLLFETYQNFTHFSVFVRS